jgi:hypothetical protein
MPQLELLLLIGLGEMLQIVLRNVCATKLLHKIQQGMSFSNFE